jgi:membrane-associated phospholipid phosphatase
MESIWQVGIAVIVALQSLGEWLVAPMKLFSSLGSIEFFLLFVSFLYWNFNALVGIRLGAILIISTVINDFFKILFHHPRPYWISTEVTAYWEETSFGIPAGHAQHAVAIWGMLAFALRKRWVWAVAITLMFLIGFSRIFLGVHFPSDVILGWGMGAIVLYATVAGWEPVSTWAKKQGARRQLGFSFLASLALIAVSLLARLILGEWQMPADWASNILVAFPDSPVPDPVSMEGTVAVAGLLFGFFAGLVWMSRQGGFSVEGSVMQKLGRYLLGLFGIVVLYIGLKAVFPAGEDLLGVIFRYARYALLAFWIAGGAPWLFLRLRLSQPG